MKRLRDESGQVLVLAALSLTAILGLVAFATDIGLLFYAREMMQNAADSAAVAGAAELNFGDMTAAAQSDSAQNGFTNGVNGTIVAVNNPPKSGPNLGKAGYVEVVVSQPQNSVFMRMFNFSSTTVSARAVAAAVPSPSCVYTLSSASPNTSDSPLGGVYVTGSADLNLSGCGILDNGNGSFAVHVTGGATLTAPSIGIVGSYTVHPGGVLQPNPPTTGITSVSDPLSSSISPPPAADWSSCSSATITTNQTIGPATPGGFICYSSLSVPSGSPTITLNPGLYVFNGSGGLNVASGATLNGTGVTFYFRNGASFSFSRGATANLSAPTTNVNGYNGILFYQDPTDTATQDSFIGGATGNLQGIFYLPTANLDIANGVGATFSVDLVVGSLSMSGAATLTPYAPLSGSSPLSVPRLAE